MKKSIAIMLILAIICTLSFTGCGEDSENSAESKNTSANSEGPKVTEAATSAPTAASTKSPETESTQTSQVKPTESAGQTDTAATNAPTTKPTDSGNTAATTTNPTSGNKTTAPTQAPTKVPTPTATTQVTNAPNKTPATSTSEPTKVPTTTEPTKGPTVTIDPTKDYSEWGNYGFENLLPAPLPFSELEWVSMRIEYPSYNEYELRTKEALDPEGKGSFSNAFKEYVKSLETYGYTIRFDSDTFFYASKKTENGRISIRFTCNLYRPLITMEIK